MTVPAPADRDLRRRGTQRAMAVVLVLSGLVVLGASSADWAVMHRTEVFEAGVAIPRDEAVAGAELAGGVVAVGIALLALALPLALWRQVGWLVLAVGLAGLGMAVAGWPGEGEVTAAPGLAVAGLGVAAVAGAVAAVRGGSPGGGPTRAATTSRYTVEAVRGEAADVLDEWDVAVATNTAAAEDEQ